VHYCLQNFLIKNKDKLIIILMINYRTAPTFVWQKKELFISAVLMFIRP